ncbi:MAG: hypothetical protein JW763_07760 [candidate division Zixibacteria bacterium]|nr:hypothetical protein [candidate division Zixibacteria bacterium]
MKHAIPTIIFGLFLAGLFLAGCDEAIVKEGQERFYSFWGAVNKNLDTDSLVLAIYLEKQDSVVTTAEITLDNDTLAFDGQRYLLSYDEADSLDDGHYILRFTDSTILSDTVGFDLPIDLEITNVILPSNRVNAGGNPVQFYWSNAVGADGYIYAAVLKDSAYKSAGYADFSVDYARQATIPRDAFRLYSTLDTGWYYIYAYAYTGSPAFDDNLPTALPASGFVDSVTHVQLSGMIGSIVVSEHDSIHVTLGK